MDKKCKLEHTLVSVIIPFYNRIPLVVESVQSVLNQTYPYFEILLVDDGSTEDTTPIHEIVRSDDRIHLIAGLHKGVSEARNLALKHVKGEYIAFLDSDDLFMPEKLGIQLDYMKENDLYFSHTSYEKMDMEGNLCGIAHSGRFNGTVYPSIIGGCPLATPTIMVRSEVFLKSEDKFKSDFHIGEDVCLWIDLAQKFDFGGLDMPLSRVRIGPSSAAYEPDKQLVGLNNIYNYCKSHPSHKEFPDQFYRLEVLMRDCKKVKQAYTDFEKKCVAATAKRKKLKSEFTQKGFMPLVSIIIPVYNGGNYLHEAIESALLQTYPNIEILVINDGSKDGGTTESIALRYGDRIRYISKPNGGVASALNLGIKEMKGEYVSWLSHDDLYTEKKVESQIRLLMKEEDKTRIICAGYELFRASDYSVIGTMNPFPMYRDKLSIPLYPVFRGLLNGCTMLIHKSHFDRVGDFDVKLPTTQDYDLWFRMLRGQSVLFQEDVHMRSRCHEEQGSRTLAHKNEAAQLWRNMTDSVTAAECIQMEGSEFEFYYNLYKFLKENLPANIHAWGHAKRKAIDCLQKQIKSNNAKRELLVRLLDRAYNDGIGMLIRSLASREKTKKRIALVTYGLTGSEEYRSVIHHMQQLQTNKEYYEIRILKDEQLEIAEQQDMVGSITIPVSKLSDDTIPTILSLLNVDCAFEFLSDDSDFDQYYNLSICDNRYVMVHDYDQYKTISHLSLNCIEEAWAVVALNEKNGFFSNIGLPNSFTYSYDFSCNLKAFVEDAVSSISSACETAWYEKIRKADSIQERKYIESLTELVFSATLLREEYKKAETERKALEAIRTTMPDSIAVPVGECEHCREMQNTISWRITKPLRLARLVQRTYQREGIVITIKKVIRKLVKRRNS